MHDSLAGAVTELKLIICQATVLKEMYIKNKYNFLSLHIIHRWICKF